MLQFNLMNSLDINIFSLYLHKKQNNMKEEKIKCKKCNKVFIISNPKKEGAVICPYCEAKIYYYILTL